MTKRIRKELKKIFLFSFVAFIIIIYKYKNDNATLEKFEYMRPKNEKEYFNYCIEIYKKLKQPNETLLFNPPLRKPPAHMIKDFEQNGYMPIKDYLYFNDVYPDAAKKSSQVIGIITKQEIDFWRNKVKNREPLGYGDKVLNDLMHEYLNEIKGKDLVVIGTLTPWIESIAFEVGATTITTLEYTHKKYQYSNMKWIHIYDYLSHAIENELTEMFDVAASFSSIEHSGLGRFGDALSPYGDLEAVEQVHCMLKPGGLFFLGVPYINQEAGFILFNAHRVYGLRRLNLLLSVGWEKIDERISTDENQRIFVLKKIERN